MKHLPITICLTLTLLLGSAGMSWNADFQKGVIAYDSDDYATALREWTPLAENEGISSIFYSKKDVILAQRKLGWMYFAGQGVPQDYETAVKWFTLSAKQGHATAQRYLGFMYDNGKGVPQDYDTAVKWYTLAAVQGDATAQYNLGLMYRKGKGVPQDYKTAVKWFTLSAKQGDADAQYNLGVMYENGRGILQDYVRAHMWINIASIPGESKNASKNRDIVAKKMSSSQLEKAQKLARECVRKKYNGCWV
jgi:TPR repeat protein